MSLLPRLPRLLILAAALLSAGCLVEDPAGPPLVLVSASLPAALGSEPVPPAERAEIALALGPDLDLGLARLLTGAPVERLAGEPRPLRLAGDAKTLAERLTRGEFETAVYATAPAMSEAAGLLQGFFRLHDRDSYLSAGVPDPQASALEGARRFVAEKLPRPMEDAPFVWLHLDLREHEPAAANAEFEAALDVLEAALAEAPDWILVGLRAGPEGSARLGARRAGAPLELPVRAPAGTESPAPGLLADALVELVGAEPESQP